MRGVHEPAAPKVKPPVNKLEEEKEPKRP